MDQQLVQEFGQKNILAWSRRKLFILARRKFFLVRRESQTVKSSKTAEDEADIVLLFESKLSLKDRKQLSFCSRRELLVSLYSNTKFSLLFYIHFNLKHSDYVTFIKTFSL